MKQTAFLLCILLVSIQLNAQKFPIGTWSSTTDAQGNPIDIKKSNGPRLATSFEFKEGTKYSFLYEEYDSSGRRILAVIENGAYSLTASQFVLTPSASTTLFFEYVPQSSKPIGNSTKQNPISPATYNWTYQKEKEEKLTIVAIKPGYREGIIPGGTTKALPRRGGGIEKIALGFRRPEPQPERSKTEHSH